MSMSKGELEGLKAAAALAILPKEQIGKVCIALATALTGAYILERKLKGEPDLTPEEMLSSTGQFLQVAIVEATGLRVTALQIDGQPVEGAQPAEGEQKATPEAESAAERAMQDVLKRMKDGGSIH